MGERGRYMNVIEKTQNVIKGANNVKKGTNKQTIKLTFFRKAQAKKVNKSCDLQSSRCIKDYFSYCFLECWDGYKLLE